MNYYLIADTHYAHSKVVQWDERHENWENMLWSKLSNVLREEDVLIHLGDVAFQQEEDWHRCLRTLPGKHILVLGNHDKRSLTFYNKYWDMVVDQFTLYIYGKRVIFSHRPVPIINAHINIHGHFHNRPLDKCFEFEPYIKEFYSGNHIRVNMDNPVVNLRKLVQSHEMEII